MKVKFFLKSCLILATAAILLAGIQSRAQAEDAAAFYKGKVLRIVVGSTPGGGYDGYCRLLAKAMQKYMGSKAIVVNKPGGGMLLAMNYMYNNASRDGLTIALAPEGLPLTQLIGTQGLQLDCLKFNWLASVYRDVRMLGVSPTSKYKTLETFRKAKGLKAASQSTTAPAGEITIMVIEALNLDSPTVITGYKGSPAQMLAIKRGEADFTAMGIHMFLGKNPPLFPIAACENKRVPEFPDLPAIFSEFKISEETQKFIKAVRTGKESGRALIAPPGVPQDRIDYLRKMIMVCLKDKELLARANKMFLTVNPVPGKVVQETVEDTFRLPPDTVKLVKYMLLKKYM